MEIFLSRVFSALFDAEGQRESRLTEFSMFGALAYGHFLDDAPLAPNAAWNDAKMLSLLKMYPNRLVVDAASTALYHQLWYFSEHHIGLATVKRAMLANPQLAKTPSVL